MKIEFFQECMAPKTTAQQKGRRTYNPMKVRNAKITWRAIARRHKPAKPLAGPLRCELAVTWPWTAAQEKQGLKSPALKQTKPDTDNIEKALWDACEDEGYFTVGDQQIADKRVTKWHGPIPGVAVMIEEMEP